MIPAATDARCRRRLRSPPAARPVRWQVRTIGRPLSARVRWTLPPAALQTRMTPSRPAAKTCLPSALNAVAFRPSPDHNRRAGIPEPYRAVLAGGEHPATVSAEARVAHGCAMPAQDGKHRGPVIESVQYAHRTVTPGGDDPPTVGTETSNVRSELGVEAAQLLPGLRAPDPDGAVGPRADDATTRGVEAAAGNASAVTPEDMEARRAGYVPHPNGPVLAPADDPSVVRTELRPETGIPDGREAPAAVHPTY